MSGCHPKNPPPKVASALAAVAVVFPDARLLTDVEAALVAEAAARQVPWER